MARAKPARAGSVISIVSLVLLGGGAACSSPSFIVRRPERGIADRAVTAMWVRDVRRVARSGDWLLTRSYSLIGDVIALATSGANVSHASVYDAERGTVIEAIAPAVREVPLEHLVDRNHYVLVVRPLGSSAEAGRAAVARARSAVGAEFDFLGMLGAGSDGRFYCSELVAWASRSALATEWVVVPSELMDGGTVLYFSGQRDDAAVRSAALRLPRITPRLAATGSARGSRAASRCRVAGWPRGCGAGLSPAPSRAPGRRPPLP